MITLRPYQEQGVSDVRAKMHHNRRILYVLPTGGGKTILFCYIAQQAVERGKKVMILVHRDKLFKQTSDSLMRFGVRHGLIGSGYPANYMLKCQVAKIGTVVNRTDKFTPDLIIIDECHHATAGQYKKIVEAYPNAFILGVTATPCRTDGAGLCEIFDVMVEGPQIYDLIDMGFLTPARLFAPETIDTSGLRITAGDYNKKDLGEIMEKPKIIGSAVEHYHEICPGAACVTFCVSVQHSVLMRDEFRRAGYTAEVVHGGLKQSEIDIILNGLGDGSIQVVTSCELISEGVDVPRIECAILQRPTASLGLYLQQVGRALRKSDGKDQAIILDHVGNIERHGRYDDHREWSLEGVKKKKQRGIEEKIILVRECPDCGYVMEPTQRKCTECGSHGNIKERQVEVIDGKLIELERKEAERKQRKSENKNAKTLPELIEIGKERGYKKGWAFGRFREKVQQSYQFNRPSTQIQELEFCTRYGLNYNIFKSQGIQAAIYAEWNAYKKTL